MGHSRQGLQPLANPEWVPSTCATNVGVIGANWFLRGHSWAAIPHKSPRISVTILGTAQGEGGRERWTLLSALSAHWLLSSLWATLSSLFLHKKTEFTWKSLCKVKRRTMKVVNDFQVTAIKVSGMYSLRDCWQCPKEILSSGSSITWPSFSIFNSSNKVKISWAFITEIMRSHFPVSTLRLVHLGSHA